MKYKLNKTFQTKFLIYFFISVFLLISIISINSSQKTAEKINFVITRLSKTSTWYDIKYGSELFIDRLKKDVYLFFDKNPSNLETYNINIQTADLRRIENIVSKKTIFDNLNEEDERWFPINFNLEGERESENYPAKIRIRGDQSIHWVNKKKSWKIKFTQEKLFKNKKSIHLILPKERMMEVELSAIKIAKKNGLLAPDSGYVLVNQNNNNMGLYFWYEMIDKFFLERNGYPIGEILSGNDVGLQNDAQLDKNSLKFYDLNSATYKAQINHSNEITSSAFLQWKKFLELLKSNDDNLIDEKIENYLDINKFAICNSLIWIFGSEHGVSINNVRWFFDPTTGLFEPIINDVFLGKDNFEAFEIKSNLMINNILKSAKVRQSILKALNKLVNEQSDFILSTFRETYSQISPYIHSGVEGYNYNLKGVGLKSPSQMQYTHDNRFNILKSNLESIKKTLSANRLFIETNLDISNEKSYYKMDIINQGVAPVSVKKVIFSSSNEKELFRIEPKISILLTNTQGYRKIIEPINSEFTKKKWSFEFNNLNLISPRYGNYIKNINKQNIKAELKWTLHIIFQNQNYKKFFDQLPANLDFIISNNITNKNVSSDNINKSQIILDGSRNLEFAGKKIIDELANTIPNDSQSIISEIPNSRIVSNNKYIFKKNNIIFPSGDYKILKDLIIPDNFNLVLHAGVKLLLSPNVNILLKGGSLNIKGTKSHPVIIDQLIPGKNWGAISVLSSNKISNLSYSKIVNGGSNIKFLAQGVYYTGQLNFFHSNVNIDNSLISYSKAEDALNIKKSSFNIDNVEFSFNKYDAFDGDWVNGEITNSLVRNNGNDGLDFSGSKVVIKNTIFEKMRDKSLSIGEQSKLDIINCRFTNSNYAIAVKDLSKVRIFGSSIYNNNFGVAVYRKKPIFGSGVVTVSGGLVWDNLRNFVTDENAKIILDNTGLNKDIISNNIKKIKLRIGKINKEYKFDVNENPIPVDKKKLSTFFLKGPITSGKDLNGNYLPNLSKNNIGMIQPLKFNGKFN